MVTVTDFARSGGLRIHFRRTGKPGRTPILVAHGLSYFSWDWLEVAQELGADREVIAMDMRGFGDSDWSPARDYSVASMGLDLVAVLDHVGWERALLIGHSMGGRSATWVAARHPARAAALVLVDYTPENAPAGTQRTTEIVGRTPDAFASIEEAMAYFGKHDRARFEQYLRKTGNQYQVKRDPFFRDQFKKVLEGGERPKLGIDMWRLIGEVRCPILSMRGARSDMYAPDTVQKMKAANSRLQVLEVDAGHNIAGENPEEFVKVMRNWESNL